MGSKVIIESQYRVEAERAEEIRELDTAHQDHFLLVAEAIIDGRDLDLIADSLVRSGWRQKEAVSFVNSIQEDLKFIIDELGRGVAHGDIVDALIEDDWLPSTAMTAVTRLDELIATTRAAMDREAKTQQYGARRRATAEIVFSALFIIIGLAFSLLPSNTTAGDGGYFVSYVAMIFGLVGLVAGLVHLTSAYQR